MKTDVDWSSIGREMAAEIEKRIMPLFGTQKAAEVVGENESGDVTEYVDMVSEEVILSRLQPLGVNIVSEESGELEAESEITVVVDPVDGSFNFTHRIPIFAFSMAVFKGTKPVYGFIHEFITGRTYEAYSGGGAFMNGERIRVKPTEPRKAAVSFYTRGRGLNLINSVKRVRVLGAIAVELSYLASGSLQAVVDVRNYVRPTDIAAGVLIAREAGAKVTDERGNELELGTELKASKKMNVVAASDERLHRLILHSLNAEGSDHEV